MGNKVRLRHTGGYGGLAQWNTKVDAGYVPYDPNLIPSYVRYGISIFGVNGSSPIFPSGNTYALSPTKSGNIAGSTTPVLLATFTMASSIGGTYNFYIRGYADNYSCNIDIRKNGVSIDNFNAGGQFPSGYQTFTRALSNLAAGDVITIYGYMYISGGTFSITECYFSSGALAT